MHRLEQVHTQQLRSELYEFTNEDNNEKQNFSKSSFKHDVTFFKGKHA